jgi:2-methylcitrate dehydratase PrpD
MKKTGKIAEFIIKQKLEISNEVLEAARKCLVDTFACMIGGYNLKVSSITSSWISEVKGKSMATMYGAGKKSFFPLAVLANATAAAALDYDDCNKLAQGHPGAAVIPSALSTAEVTGANGKDVLEAIIVGYEVGLRFGSKLITSSSSSEVYGSGRWGCVGAAATACRLLDLDHKKTCNALGIAASYLPVAPLLGEDINYDYIPMTKESIGWGSFTGVCSALLAAEGYTGPPITAGDKFDSLGKEFVIRDTFFKPYPSCRWTHAAIEAALKLREEIIMSSAEEIKKISILIYRKAVNLNFKSPSNEETAQYSLPFTVAAALVNGEFSLKQMNQEGIWNTKVRELAKKVEVIYEPVFDNDFPRLHSTQVEVEDKTGKKFIARVDIPSGDPECPMNWEDLKNKFLQLVTTFLDKSTALSLLSDLKQLEKLKDLKKLTAYFIN